MKMSRLIKCSESIGAVLLLLAVRDTFMLVKETYNNLNR